MVRKKRADQRKHHFIYKTTCGVTGRYYIGMHSTDIMDDGYLGSGKWLRRSLKKHGEHNHVREVMEDCSGMGRTFLREREAQLVDKDLLSDPMCMNIVQGGNSGGRPSGPGKPLTPEHRAKIAAANKGKVRSAEANEASSQAAKKRWRDPEYRKRMGKVAAERGYKHSIECRRKIGEAAKGRKLSIETRQKMSESAKARCAKARWAEGKL